MMKFRNKKHNIDKRASLIPLINVIFVILIFFLVLYKFASVDLSGEDDTNDEKENKNFMMSESGDITKSENIIIAQISDFGTLFVDGEETTNSVSNIKEHTKGKSSVSFLIVINEDAPYRVYANFLYNLRLAGVKNIKTRSQSNR